MQVLNWKLTNDGGQVVFHRERDEFYGPPSYPRVLLLLLLEKSNFEEMQKNDIVRVVRRDVETSLTEKSIKLGRKKKKY